MAKSKGITEVVRVIESIDFPDLDQGETVAAVRMKHLHIENGLIVNVSGGCIGVPTAGHHKPEAPVGPPVDTDCDELSKLEKIALPIAFWILVGSLWALVIYFTVLLYKIVAALNG